MKKSASYLALAALLFTTALRAEIIEQVLVKVNGEIITKTQLERLQVAALRELPNAPDLSRATDEEVGKLLAQVTPTVIVSAIDEMLLLQRAKELGLSVTDEQFSAVVESIKKDNNFTTDEQFQAALKSEGLALADLRQMLSKRMLINQLQQREILKGVDITPEEEKKYYDENQAEFATTPSVTLREILVANPPDPKKGINVAADEAARQKIEDIRARDLKGESYEKLAGELSDAPSKANAGLIGPISRNELDERLAKMFATMKVGEVTEVVQLSNGYAIFKLESSIESTTMPFEEAGPRIRERLGGEKLQAETRKYLDRLRSQAIIQWSNEEIYKAWKAGLSARQPV
jgi:peptidyl-prolyl cis-trans isomerase SurA